MDRRFTLNNAALSVFCVLFGVPFDDIYVFDQNATFFMIDFQYLTDFTRIFAGNYFYFIIFFQMTYIFYHEPLLRQAL